MRSVAADPYRYFRVEAREILAGLGEGALSLERQPQQPEVLTRLLRLAHTLKGAARVVRQPGIAQLAHALEDVLAPRRDEGTPVSAADVAELLRLVDAIAVHVVALDAPTAPTAPSPVGPADEPPALAGADEAFETVRVDLREMDALLESVFEVGVQVAAMRRDVLAVGEARSLAGAVVDHLRPRPGTAPGTPVRALALAEALVASLDRAQAGLAEARDRAEIELAEVHDRAHQVRLVPASMCFGPLGRAVHDAAQVLGKRASLRTTGGDVRLDAHVLESVREALMHVVRNAVAHGIESPDRRESAGKARVGTVDLRVSRVEGRVSFRCADDGAGIDVEAVRAVARGRGLVDAAAAAALTADSAVPLLLRGGVSTAAQVDSVAGRGVGFDVVRAVCERLKGEVRVSSEPGAGTVVELLVPVSLTSIVALEVVAGGRTAWIPLDAVARTLRPRGDDVVQGTGSRALAAGEGTVPLARLDAVLGLPSAASRAVMPVVVVRSGAEELALEVERVVAARTVVVRPLPPGVGKRALVAGATLDAEGIPQLVLHPAGLLAAARALGGAGPRAPTRRLPILVVDDSMTTRMLEQSILESAGYEVDVAASAEAGLARAAERTYGLFVVDVEMPGMDGFEFVARTRADPSLRDTPCFLVTSRGSPDDRRRGAEAGAVAYIVKSEFDQAALLGLVDRHLGVS